MTGSENADYENESLRGDVQTFRATTEGTVGDATVTIEVEGLNETLADDPREDAARGVDLDATRRCVENLEAALERGDRPEIRERMGALKEELSDE